jgi:hypothetical protein
MTADFECPPILFLIFNRPDLTRRTFERIRSAKPSRLFIAADGPRKDRPGEDLLCAESRTIAEQVDWECKIETLFRDENLGCKRAVSSAISWFFKREAEGIILEDDVLPDPTFFRFCGELLERYRLDPNVMMISGNYLLGSKQRPAASYYFSRYTHIWGWASWRRAWALYDRDMSEWPKLRDSNFLLRIGNGGLDYAAYWTAIFNATYEGRVDTWDYQWLFTTMANHGLAITPSRNLVRNIGFRPDAAHTTGDGGPLARLPLESIQFPLTHPPIIAVSPAADRWEDAYVFGSRVSLARRVRNRLTSIAKAVGRVRVKLRGN